MASLSLTLFEPEVYENYDSEMPHSKKNMPYSLDEAIADLLEIVLSDVVRSWMKHSSQISKIFEKIYIYKPPDL